ncbi:MAG: hypothetical protein GXO25_07175 [Euryarchaeota archaeon]|nr:hypothetical protein [Euryarchaeota archaeon]
MKVAGAVFNSFMRKLSSKFLKSDDEMLGYFRNLHPVGSQNPFEAHLHIHLTLINLVFRERDGEMEFVRFNPVMNVDEIRTMWKSALAEHGIDVPGNVDVHTQYKKVGTGYFLHWVKYSARRFSYDYSEYLFANPLPESWNKEFVRNVLEYRNQRVNYGWLRKMTYIEDNLPNIRIVRDSDNDVLPLTEVEHEDVKRTPEMFMPDVVDELPRDVAVFVQHRGHWYKVVRKPPAVMTRCIVQLILPSDPPG